MSKKVAVDRAHGRHISGLHRPGREAPFLFAGFELARDAALTESGQSPEHGSVNAVQQTPSGHASSLARRTDAGQEPDLRMVVSDGTIARSPRARADKTSVEEEVEAIRATHDEVSELIHTIMEDVHDGRCIDIEGAKKVVATMVESVLRNPDALLCFAQQKRREHYTALHCLRVCILATVFGHHLNLGQEELNFLGLGALLHDVGKMRVPDAIINKPDTLSEREYEIMKSHVPMSVEILQRTGAVPPAVLDVVRHIHERYAGHGYMDGLEGDQISRFGRIGAIVDVYDALTSDRIYQDGLPPRDALRNMYERKAKDFDPQLLDQFIQCVGVYPIGSVVVLNTFEVGVVRMLNGEQRLKPQVALATKPDRTPYPALRVVDLAREIAPTGEPYQIIQVVPPAMFNIEPVDYLPVKALA